MSVLIEWVGILAPGILLILSELIGASKLKSNGVIELIMEILQALQDNKKDSVIGSEIKVEPVKKSNDDDMA